MLSSVRLRTHHHTGKCTPELLDDLASNRRNRDVKETDKQTLLRFVVKGISEADTWTSFEPHSQRLREAIKAKFAGQHIAGEGAKMIVKP